MSKCELKAKVEFNFVSQFIQYSPCCPFKNTVMIVFSFLTFNYSILIIYESLGYSSPLRILWKIDIRNFI